MRPWLLRPAWYLMRSTSVFSGLPLVTSAKSGTVAKRAPFDDVCSDLCPTSDSFDLLAVGDRDDRLLPLAGHTDRLAAADRLARHHLGADAGDLDLEERLDRLLDLDLVRVLVDFERVRVVLVLQVDRLLGDARTLDDVVDVHRLSPSASARRRGRRAQPW